MTLFNSSGGPGGPLVVPYPIATFTTLPTASLNTGKIFFVSDVGLPVGSLWISDGTRWKPLYPITIDRSAVAQSAITGDTSEHAAKQVTIPANVMGAGGRLMAMGLFTYTGSTNSKTIRIRFSGASLITGTAFSSIATAVAGNVTGRLITEIANRGVTNSQVGATAGLGYGQTTTGGSANAVATVDTTLASNIAFTGQLTSFGESIVLEAYEVWLYS